MLHHILTISFGLLAAALVGHALLCRSRARARRVRVPRFFFITLPPPAVCDRTKTWAQERCEFDRWTRTQRAYNAEMDRLLKGDRR
jgi:hypothetical protein